MPSLSAPENTHIQHRQQLAVVNRVLWGLAIISEAYTEPVRCATVPRSVSFAAVFLRQLSRCALKNEVADHSVSGRVNGGERHSIHSIRRAIARGCKPPVRRGRPRRRQHESLLRCCRGRLLSAEGQAGGRIARRFLASTGERGLFGAADEPASCSGTARSP